MLLYITNIALLSDYRIAFSGFRAGSHTLEIERGRYNNPRTPIEHIFCTICQEVEDEKHLLISCKLYHFERGNLFNNIGKLYPQFVLFSELERKCVSNKQVTKLKIQLGW